MLIRRSLKLYFGISIPALLLVGCGGSSLQPAQNQTNNLSATQDKIVGSWSVTDATCNGNSISASYLPTGGSLSFQFNGSNLSQIKSASNGCFQSITMPYAIDGSTMTVPNGATFSASCTPAACTGPGLMPSSFCGASGPISASPAIFTFASSQLVHMSSTDGDTKAAATCGQHGGTAPLVLIMTKQ